jgi:uncharacterized membrane protein YphA (DoxX/SURF4 family)
LKERLPSLGNSHEHSSLLRNQRRPFEQFIHFFKNVAIAGGLPHVMAFGRGRLSLDGRRA